MKGKECLSQHKIRKINPLLSPKGFYLFQAHLRGGLIEMRGLFNKKLRNELNSKLFRNDNGISSP